LELLVHFCATVTDGFLVQTSDKGQQGIAPAPHAVGLGSRQPATLLLIEAAH
jgi:hypothetical protein